MLDFFRNVAQTIPSSSPSPVAPSNETSTTGASETGGAGSTREMLQDRAGIIVLREDLDFYAIPPKVEIDQPEMIEVKRAAGRALLGQDGIFSGLKRSEEAGTTEQHLIEMLTAGYVNLEFLSPFVHLNSIFSSTYEIGHSLNLAYTEDSIMTTAGVIELESPTKLSSVVLRSHAYGQILRVPILQIAMPSGWLKNYYCFGGSRQGDAGGKGWNSKGWKA